MKELAKALRTAGMTELVKEQQMALAWVMMMVQAWVIKKVRWMAVRMESVTGPH